MCQQLSRYLEESLLADFFYCAWFWLDRVKSFHNISLTNGVRQERCLLYRISIFEMIFTNNQPFNVSSMQP